MVTILTLRGALYLCSGTFTGPLECSVSLFPTPLSILKGNAGLSWYGSRAQFILFLYHLAYDPPRVLLCLLSKEMSYVLPTEDGSLMNVK